jgi:hypothetical protein
MMLQCPGCKARVAINATAASGLLIERKPTTVIIYDCGTPVHSCDLEPAGER